jgi:Tol biopolymer transport system component/DNA-binding winged helix-turn-helix (wHTH) protein
MTASSPARQRIRFDVFEADLHTEELFRSGSRIRLPNQSFRVLALLLERAGQLVTREELRARLWPPGRLVEYDQALNTAVNRLREALRESAEAPRFIETLPKRGYRFIATIQPDPVSPGAAAPDAPAESSNEGNVPAALANTANEPGTAATEGPLTAASPVAVARALANRGRRPPHHEARFAGAMALGMILLLGVILWLRAPHSANQSPSGWKVVPFTSLPGQAIAPTFSPDGSQIAFAWNGETGDAHQFDLYVKSVGSERLLRLTHRPSRRVTPAWSPDGGTIAFVRDTGDALGLFVIPALGGPERQIARNLALESSMQISWSPDGRVLAYAAYGPTGAPRIYTVSMDSLTTQLLSPAPDCMEAGEPAFSPDGNELALSCMSSSGVYAVYVARLPHGPLRRLASILGDPQGLTWSADGKRLVLANDPGDGGELWQLSLDGHLRQLPFGEEGSAPAVSARGGRTAYVRGRKTIDIWRADLTAANPEASATKLIYSTFVQTNPRYSPDGSRIAFQSNRSGSTEIWTTDAQGENPDRLTSFNGPLTSAPSWCSDGRRLAFDSRVSGISAIYIEDVQEGVPRKVVSSRDNLSSPVWSQDCRWLFAIEEDHATLYRVSSSGGRAERFTPSPSNHCEVIGDRLVFNAMGATGVVLWTKPVGGGREVPLENMPKLAYEDAWTATPTGVYYTDNSSKPPAVKFYDLQSRTIRPIAALNPMSSRSAGPDITVSPDRHWLLYGQVDDEQSEIMLGPPL